MSYVRVIPRDLFNEANLLKCLGHLYILLETTRSKAKFDVEGVPVFDVRQDNNDGSIYLANVPFSVDGRSVHLSRPLNSRDQWPLYLSIPEDPDFEPFEVFESTGFFSEAMLNFIEARH
jgi:hypothetical protein